MWKVMNVTGLKFLSNEAKKLAATAIGITKKAAKTCLKIQFNAAIFPFIFAYGGIKYVFKWFRSSDSDDSCELEQPRSDAVVGNAKKLRTSFVSSMNAFTSKQNTSSRCLENVHKGENKYEKQLNFPDLTVEDKFSTTGNLDTNVTLASLKVNEFSGSDLLWDIPILSAKAKYFARCVKEERENDMVEARKALEEHPVMLPMPGRRKDIKEMINKAENKNESPESSVIKVNYSETINAENCSAYSCTDSDSFEEKYKQKNKFCSHDASSRLSPRHKTKCVYNPVLKQDKMCREISTVNKTLGKIQATCSQLLGELSNLNEALTKVIFMKEKLANLEFQVDEGKRLLQEVECDRFIMKSKLSALEKLINEEEKFLSGDMFCESGFYESVETTGEF